MDEILTNGADLSHALASALNQFSAENGSNTPDFILAQYLLGCLAAFNAASRARETWYGQSLRIGAARQGDNGPTENRDDVRGTTEPG
jgi:hypothetical protein